MNSSIALASRHRQPLFCLPALFWLAACSRSTDTDDAPPTESPTITPDPYGPREYTEGEEFSLTYAVADILTPLFIRTHEEISLINPYATGDITVSGLTTGFLTIDDALYITINGAAEIAGTAQDVLDAGFHLHVSGPGYGHITTITLAIENAPDTLTTRAPYSHELDEDQEIPTASQTISLREFVNNDDGHQLELLNLSTIQARLELEANKIQGLTISAEGENIILTGTPLLLGNAGIYSFALDVVIEEVLADSGSIPGRVTSTLNIEIEDVESAPRAVAGRQIDVTVTDLSAAATQTIDLNAYFFDPEGEKLTFSTAYTHTGLTLEDINVEGIIADGMLRLHGSNFSGDSTLNPNLTITDVAGQNLTAEITISLEDSADIIEYTQITNATFPSAPVTVTGTSTSAFQIVEANTAATTLTYDWADLVYLNSQADLLIDLANSVLSDGVAVTTSNGALTVTLSVDIENSQADETVTAMIRFGPSGDPTHNLSLTYTIDNLNDAPELVSNPVTQVFTATEGTQIDAVLIERSDYFHDSDGNHLFFAFSTSNSYGFARTIGEVETNRTATLQGLDIELTPDGAGIAITGTPDLPGVHHVQAISGGSTTTLTATYTLTLTVSEEELDTATNTLTTEVTFTVAATNEAPHFDGAAQTIDFVPGAPISATMYTATDDDGTDDTLTYTSNDTLGLKLNASTGEISGDLNVFPANRSITITVTDLEGESDTFAFAVSATDNRVLRGVVSSTEEPTNTGEGYGFSAPAGQDFKVEQLGDIDGDGKQEYLVQQVERSTSQGKGAFVLFGGLPDDTAGTIDAHRLVTDFANNPAVAGQFLAFAPRSPYTVSDILSVATQGALGITANDTLPVHLGDVNNIGDFDGDGYDDFAVIMAIEDSSQTGNERGIEAYLYYGGPDYEFGEAGNSLTILQRGVTNGLVVPGKDDPADDVLNLNFRAVYRGGDLDGDGADEMIVAGRNSFFLIFGREDWRVDGAAVAPINIYQQPTGYGLVFGDKTPVNYDVGGVTKTANLNDPLIDVDGGFDITGDGINDLVMLYESPTLLPDDTLPAGVEFEVYAWVLPGDDTAHFANGQDVVINGHAIEINDTPIDFETAGAMRISFQQLAFLEGYSGFGGSISIGNINGDEYADIIYARPHDEYASAGENPGTVQVVYGNATVDGQVANASGKYDPRAVEFADLDTTRAVQLNGENNGDGFGTAVASGDIDGDGYDDLLIGAPGFDGATNTDTGRTYAIFGQSSLRSGLDVVIRAGDRVTRATFDPALLQEKTPDGLPLHSDLGFVIDGFRLTTDSLANGIALGSSVALVDSDGLGVSDLLVVGTDGGVGSNNSGVLQFIKGGDFRLSARAQYDGDGNLLPAYEVGKQDNPLGDEVLRGSAGREVFLELDADNPAREIYAGAGNDTIVLELAHTDNNHGTKLEVIHGGGGVDVLQRQFGQFELPDPDAATPDTQVFRSIEVIDLWGHGHLNGGASLEGLTPGVARDLVSEEGGLGIDGKRVLVILGNKIDHGDYVALESSDGWQYDSTDSPLSLTALYQEDYFRIYGTEYSALTGTAKAAADAEIAAKMAWVDELAVATDTNYAIPTGSAYAFSADTEFDRVVTDDRIELWIEDGLLNYS